MFRLYDTAGSQVTYQRLVEKPPVKSHETAAAYIAHLESAFLCNVLGCYDPDKDMAAPGKARKIYFIAPLLYRVAGGYLRGIRNENRWWEGVLAGREMWGRLFETVVVTTLARRHERMYFWYSSNTKQEVDVVVREGSWLKLMEIKSSMQAVRPVFGKPVELITPENIEF